MKILPFPRPPQFRILSQADRPAGSGPDDLLTLNLNLLSQSAHLLSETLGLEDLTSIGSQIETLRQRILASPIDSADGEAARRRGIQVLESAACGLIALFGELAITARPTPPWQRACPGHRADAEDTPPLVAPPPSA